MTYQDNKDYTNWEAALEIWSQAVYDDNNFWDIRPAVELLTEEAAKLNDTEINNCTDRAREIAYRQAATILDNMAK